MGGAVTPVPLYSTAPEQITVMVGAEPTYKTAGGAAPYYVTSSNVNVASVTQTADTFTVKGVARGQASIAIRDSSVAPLTIIVEVL